MKNNNKMGRRPRPMSAGQRAFEARKAARIKKLHEEQNQAAIALYNTRRHFTSAELKSMNIDKFLETWWHLRDSQAKFDVQMVTTELLRRARRYGMDKECKDVEKALEFVKEKARSIKKIPYEKLLEKCKDFVSGNGALDYKVDTPAYVFLEDEMTDTQRETYRLWVEKVFIPRIEEELKRSTATLLPIKEFYVCEFISQFDALDLLDRDKFAKGFCSPDTIKYAALFAKTELGNLGMDVTDAKTAYEYVTKLRKKV